MSSMTNPKGLRIDVRSPANTDTRCQCSDCHGTSVEWSPRHPPPPGYQRPNILAATKLDVSAVDERYAFIPSAYMTPTHSSSKESSTVTSSAQTTPFFFQPSGYWYCGECFARLGSWKADIWPKTGLCGKKCEGCGADNVRDLHASVS